MHISLLYMFISILYMFRALKCSSSGDSIVSIRYLVYVTLCFVYITYYNASLYYKALLDKKCQQWHLYTAECCPLYGGKFFLHVPWRCVGGSGSIPPLILNLGNDWRWGGQLPVPAAIPRGKSFRYTLNWRLDGPHRRSGWVWRRENLLSPPGFEPRTVHPVTTCYTNYRLVSPCPVLRWWDFVFTR